MAGKAESPQEPYEPGGRKQQNAGDMTSDDLAAAYADATRLRAHELSWHLDGVLGNWMKEARDVLSKREHLELIREFLPVYFDPSRKVPVFGPGGKLASQGALEKAVSQRALKAAG
jgi:hypothetical protein